MPSRPSRTGMFCAGGAVRKCSSMVRKPAEERPEARVADRDRQRQAHGRVDRVAAAHPVPEAEHVGRVDAELGHRLRVGRDGDEVARHGGVAEGADQPVARPARVGERLERREGLGDDDDERRGRVARRERVADVVAVHVRDEAEGDVRVGVVGEGADGHRRAEVRSADADVDDGADALPRGARPLPRAHPLGQVAHPVEHGVDVGDDVAPVHLDHARRGAPAAPRGAPPAPR